MVFVWWPGGHRPDGEGGPVLRAGDQRKRSQWIPAFAGMTALFFRWRARCGRSRDGTGSIPMSVILVEAGNPPHFLPSPRSLSSTRFGNGDPSAESSFNALAADLGFLSFVGLMAAAW